MFLSNSSMCSRMKGSSMMVLVLLFRILSNSLMSLFWYALQTFTTNNSHWLYTATGRQTYHLELIERQTVRNCKKLTQQFINLIWVFSFFALFPKKNLRAILTTMFSTNPIIRSLNFVDGAIFFGYTYRVWLNLFSKTRLEDQFFALKLKISMLGQTDLMNMLRVKWRYIFLLFAIIFNNKGAKDIWNILELLMNLFT